MKTISQNLYARFLILCAALVLTLTQTGCATGYAGSAVSHGFGFNAWKDSPGIEVLDFRYGDGGSPSVRSRLANEKTGETVQSTTIIGQMRVGKDLYVKWRIKATGEVLEDTVDLQTAWPHSLEDLKIYFIIEDKQLYVYLISQIKQRPYFTSMEVVNIDLFTARPPRQRALRMYTTSYVTMIYPQRQLDPHLPPDLRRKP